MDLIKKYLPKTYYAGLSSEERLKMLIKHWQRAIKVNQELEEKISKSAGNAGYKEPADTDEIDVWRIEAKGLGTAYYEDDIRVIEDMLKECDYDEGYIITKHKMNAKEYKELPEFTGF